MRTRSLKWPGHHNHSGRRRLVFRQPSDSQVPPAYPPGSLSVVRATTSTHLDDEYESERIGAASTGSGRCEGSDLRRREGSVHTTVGGVVRDLGSSGSSCVAGSSRSRPYAKRSAGQSVEQWLGKSPLLELQVRDCRYVEILHVALDSLRILRITFVCALPSTIHPPSLCRPLCEILPVVIESASLQVVFPKPDSRVVLLCLHPQSDGRPVFLKLVFAAAPSAIQSMFWPKNGDAVLSPAGWTRDGFCICGKVMLTVGTRNAGNEREFAWARGREGESFQWRARLLEETLKRVLRRLASIGVDSAALGTASEHGAHRGLHTRGTDTTSGEPAVYLGMKFSVLLRPTPATCLQGSNERNRQDVKYAACPFPVTLLLLSLPPPPSRWIRCAAAQCSSRQRTRPGQALKPP
uniref:Uncharacterized protein n=1 Tax=Mycena chlorophos TaxID=658473 RepID=A0ABQ0LIW1_MYCCL|nr:predicted protein [Mycena chlorophos]